MAPIKVAINGFGRIGRTVMRILCAKPGEFQVVAINDLCPVDTNAHLLKYDTVMGRFNGTVTVADGNLVVNGQTVKVLAERSPANLPWGELGVDVVVESTGVFRKRESEKGGYGDHIKAGARKVILTVPAADDIDATVVLGVNDEALKAGVNCVSNASCTTNCLAPVAKVLNDTFGIVRGMMTTVHAYTNDQNISDVFHSDLRRARAGAANIIPTTTGAARAVGQVIPELKGKLDGGALRVPVITGSAVDLTVELAKDASVEDINAAIKAAAEGPMKGILAYCEDEIVSSDIIGDSHSSVFDAKSTQKIKDSKMVKILSWYDNEYGYSARTVDLIKIVAGL